MARRSCSRYHPSFDRLGILVVLVPVGDEVAVRLLLIKLALGHHSLFWGAIGAMKNPSQPSPGSVRGRRVAREVVLLADLLHRMLDDIADSLGLG